MRSNLPVTGNEREMRDGTTISSRTDLRGVISYGNQVFIDISGYSEQELLGAPHNIVRHPDMPPKAFQALWKVLNRDRPWTGRVKNRCKNGDYHWVKANVTPTKEKGQIVGALSVRVKPSRAEIEAAEHYYQLFRDGKAKNLAVQDGRIVKTDLSSQGTKRFNNASIRLRLISTLGFMMLALAVLIGLGLFNLQRSTDAIDELYRQAVLAQHLASDIRSRVADNRMQVALYHAA